VPGCAGADEIDTERDEQRLQSELLGHHLRVSRQTIELDEPTLVGYERPISGSRFLKDLSLPPTGLRIQALQRLQGATALLIGRLQLLGNLLGGRFAVGTHNSERPAHLVRLVVDHPEPTP